MQNPFFEAGTRAALPLAPSLDATLAAAHMPHRVRPLDRRTVGISAIAMVLGAAMAGVAHLLIALIALVTQLAFYGRWSTAPVSPIGHHLGAWVIVVPVLGGLIVGAMARWGSRAIRGHGIPEAMEQVLLNQSRIAPRLIWLKPLSSAIAIGTGGPFGAEGPIIATGGALGSWLAQRMRVTADERKTLLAAGAAAGMSAVFAAPISAVLLAIELLLFERRARSLIPVALAAATAAGVRALFEGSAPVFPMAAFATPTLPALGVYVLLGALIGAVSVGVTKLVYAIEDAFEHLPIHWMWWPALGGLAVGIIGYVMPATLGVGYINIDNVLTGRLGLAAMFALCAMKLLSWSVALGSGTSGGTLAPLFTIGSALGGVCGVLIASAAPWLHIDPQVAALVAMAAIFAGASRAFLTSVVFAFETTQQPHGLLPLLGACAAALLVSSLLMRNTIMTEKIARRGVRVPSDYEADFLARITAGDACSRDVVCLRQGQRVNDIREWLVAASPQAHHQGFPVLDAEERVLGVVTRRQFFEHGHADIERVEQLITRAPVTIHEQQSLRDAADQMVDAQIGRLLVISADKPQRLLGMLTRGDLLAAHGRRLREARDLPGRR